MIRINLLPYHLRPVKRSPLPYIVSVVFFAMVMMAIVGMFIGQQARTASKRSQLSLHQQELESLKTVVDEYNQLTDQQLRLADKIAIIQEIVSDRIIWSRQLFNISRLTPDNFWFSSVSEKEKQMKESRLVVDEKTGKTQMKTEPVKRRVLELGGYVIQGPDGSNDISPLTFNTEQDPEFSTLFQLNSTKLLDTEFESYKVRSFTLEYLINTGGEAP